MSAPSCSLPSWRRARPSTKRGWSMSEPWLSTHIERWPTEKLVPYARNARTHSEEQVAQIAASIVEFGFTNPILAGSDGVIVASHGSLAAAQKDRKSTRLNSSH